MLSRIKMGKEILAFGDIEIEKKVFLLQIRLLFLKERKYIEKKHIIDDSESSSDSSDHSDDSDEV